MSRGLLLVISGPAGSGKGTVIKYLMEKEQNIAYSVSVKVKGEDNIRLVSLSLYLCCSHNNTCVSASKKASICSLLPTDILTYPSIRGALK